MDQTEEGGIVCSPSCRVLAPSLLYRKLEGPKGRETWIRPSVAFFGNRLFDAVVVIDLLLLPRGHSPKCTPTIGYPLITLSLSFSSKTLVAYAMQGRIPGPLIHYTRQWS